MTHSAWEPLHAGEDAERLRRRALRIGLEAAAVRLAAAGNDLVNAHLRLAWEANAAAREDVTACGFEPDSNRFDNWADVDRMRRAVGQMRKRAHAVLPHFALQRPFEEWVSDSDVEEMRWLRHRIVHRDRPSYADAPAIGRASLWTGESFSVSFPPPAAPQAGSVSTIIEIPQLRSREFPTL